MDSHHYFHIRDTLHTRPRPAASQLAHAPTKRTGALVLAGDVRTQDHLIARQVVRCGVTMHMAYWQAPTINSIRSMVGLLTGYGGCLRWPMKRAVGKGWEVGGKGGIDTNHRLPNVVRCCPDLQVPNFPGMHQHFVGWHWPC